VDTLPTPPSVSEPFFFHQRSRTRPHILGPGPAHLCSCLHAPQYVRISDGCVVPVTLGDRKYYTSPASRSSYGQSARKNKRGRVDRILTDRYLVIVRSPCRPELDDIPASLVSLSSSCLQKYRSLGFESILSHIPANSSCIPDYDCVRSVENTHRTRPFTHSPPAVRCLQFPACPALR